MPLTIPSSLRLPGATEYGITLDTHYLSSPFRSLFCLLLGFDLTCLGSTLLCFALLCSALHRCRCLVAFLLLLSLFVFAFAFAYADARLRRNHRSSRPSIPSPLSSPSYTASSLTTPSPPWPGTATSQRRPPPIDTRSNSNTTPSSAGGHTTFYSDSSNPSSPDEERPRCVAYHMALTPPFVQFARKREKEKK